MLKTLILHYYQSVYNLSLSHQYSLHVADINNLTEHTNFRVSLAKAIMKSNMTSKPDQPAKLLDIFPSWKDLDWGTVSVLTSPEYSRTTKEVRDIQQEDHYTYLKALLLILLSSYLFTMIIKPIWQHKELYSPCHSFPVVSIHPWHRHRLIWDRFWSLILINIAGAYLTLCLEVFMKEACTSWSYPREQITSNKTLHISRLNFKEFPLSFSWGESYIYIAVFLYATSLGMSGKNKILLWKYCSTSSSLHGEPWRSSHVRVHHQLQIKQVLLTLYFLSTLWIVTF